MVEEETIKSEVKQSKSGNKILIYGLTLLALFIIIAFVFSSGMFTDVFKTCREEQVPYESQEEYLKTEYYTETVPYTNKVCEQKDYIYAIENEKDEFVSNNLVLTYDFVNRDTEKITFKGGATWIINNQVVYFADYDPNICCNYDVYPDSKVTVDKTFPNPSPTQKGRANVIVPRKTVCNDVIKYKDVQKERQVTAYRPVTKYRTETKCD